MSSVKRGLPPISQLKKNVGPPRHEKDIHSLVGPINDTRRPVVDHKGVRSKLPISVMQSSARTLKMRLVNNTVIEEYYVQYAKTCQKLAHLKKTLLRPIYYL